MTDIFSDLTQISKWIVQLNESKSLIQGNRNRCLFLINRCSSFQEGLNGIGKEHYGKVGVSNAVHFLCTTIGACLNFVQKYGMDGCKRFIIDESAYHSTSYKYTDLHEQLKSAAHKLKFGFVTNDSANDTASRADNDDALMTLIELLELNEKNFELKDLLVTSTTSKLFVIGELMPDVLKNSSAVLDLVYADNSDTEASEESGMHKPSASKWTFSTMDISHLQWDKRNEIGHSAYGKVYEGAFAGVSCAVKVLDFKTSLSADHLKMIQREVHIMNALNHVSIVALIGFSIDVNCVLIATELATCSLHQLIHHHGAKYSTHTKLKWFIDIGKALSYLHFHGIIHKNIKPANILMYVTQDGKYLAKVTDCGLSNIGTVSQNKTRSLPYMAPELIICEVDVLEYSAAADMYAFGVVMNEVMSEKIPWSGIEHEEVMVSIANGKRLQAFLAQSKQEELLVELLYNSHSGCLAILPSSRPSGYSIVTQLKNIVKIVVEDFAGQISPLRDEDSLYSDIFDQRIKVWDMSNHACVATLTGHNEPVHSLVLSTNKLYTGSGDKLIKVWDVSNHAYVATLTGHSGAVWSLVCGGDKLYSGSGDMSIKVWDVSSYACVATMDGQTKWVMSLVYSDHILYSGSNDIKVWDV